MKKTKIMKMTIYLLMSVMILAPFALPITADGSGDIGKEHLNKLIEDTGSYLIKAIGEPSYGMVGGDWAVLGLARSNMELPKNLTATYYKNVEAVLKEKKGELTRSKYSEYSRLILALSSIGKNPASVAGYDLIEKLSDLGLVEKQGINGSIYALLALDCKGFSFTDCPGNTIRTTRELLINTILKHELPEGGFSLNGTTADPDVTAAALQALGKYRDRDDVKEAICRSLSFLSKVQTSSGGFSGWSTEGKENAESISQVILALTSLGIDPGEDGRFIKTDSRGKNNSPLDALMAFRLPDGGYKHILGGSSDIMAAEQAMLALVSFQRLSEEKNALFDMEDVIEESTSPGAAYTYKVMLNGEYLTFSQPPINTNGKILVPMRRILETLGAKVDWDENLRLVTGTLGDRTVQLTIGMLKAKVNSDDVELEVPAVIQNGSTLVPLRFISESLGAIVRWDKETNTAVILSEAEQL